MLTLSDRFHSGYEINSWTNDCWIWQRSKDKNGYGYIKKDKKTTKAHRVSYGLHYGEFPPELWVLHRCDNPSCVNPEHLFLGTALENNHDMIRKGRGRYPGAHLKGSTNGRSKLTEEDVLWIRSNYKWGSGPQLALKYGVHVGVIRRVIQQRSWKHI